MSNDAGSMAKVTGAKSHASSPSATTIPDATSQYSGFLILAPVLSNNYASASSSRASSVNSTSAPAPNLARAPLPSTSAIDDSTPADLAEQIKKDRRSSSVSSNGTFRRRILKLGPVHGGESGVSDYVEFDE